MSLTTMQAKNVDKFMTGKIVDVGSYYAPSATRFLIQGTRSVSASLEIDSAENKTEGYIQALYGRILKATGSVELGKISLEGLAMMLGQTYSTSAGVNAFLRIRKKAQLPLVFFDFQSLYDVSNGSADNRFCVFKAMLSNFEFELTQDDFAMVSFDWNGIFTEFPTVRTDADSLEVAILGRQATASTTLGGFVETTAAA